jgi:hypothetical protein
MASDLTEAERAEVLERLVRELEGMRSYAASVQKRLDEATAKSPSHKWDMLNLAKKRAEIVVAEEQLAALRAADADARVLEHMGKLSVAAPPPAAAAAGPTPEELAERAAVADRWLDYLLTVHELSNRQPQMHPSDRPIFDAASPTMPPVFCVRYRHQTYIMFDDTKMTRKQADTFLARLRARFDRRTRRDGPTSITEQVGIGNLGRWWFDPAAQLDAFYDAYTRLIDQLRSEHYQPVGNSIAAPGVSYAELLAVNAARRADDADWALHLVEPGAVVGQEHGFGRTKLGIAIRQIWTEMLRKISAAGAWPLGALAEIVKGPWPSVPRSKLMTQLWLDCLIVAHELDMNQDDCFYNVTGPHEVAVAVVTSHYADLVDKLGQRHPGIVVRSGLREVRPEPQKQLDVFYAALAQFIEHLRTVEPHGKLLGKDVLAPQITYEYLVHNRGQLSSSDFCLCLWTPGEQIDFTQPNVPHPWAAARSNIVQHISALWQNMVEPMMHISMYHMLPPDYVKEGDVPHIYRGPWQAERWRVFNGMTFSMRQRAAMIGAVEQLYNEFFKVHMRTKPGGKPLMALDNSAFRRTVLQRAAWLPHVGTLLYHGTREPSFLGDADALDRLRTVTFFSLDAPMSQVYAQHNMLAFRLARELPEPMVHIQHLEDNRTTTHDLLAQAWQLLFGYPRSFFTRAAEIVAKLWGTGMLVTQVQHYGRLDGMQSSGMEVVLCEPQRYLEHAPVTLHLGHDLFNGRRLMYDAVWSGVAPTVEFVLYKLFIEQRAWQVFVGPLPDFEVQVLRRLLDMFAPADIATWGQLRANTVCLFQRSLRLYNQRTNGARAAGTLEPYTTPDTLLQVLPPDQRRVYVHDVHAVDRALRAFFKTVARSALPIYGLAAAWEVLMYNVEHSTTLLFAEREYPRFLRMLPWARAQLDLPRAFDVVRVDNGLVYYWTEPATNKSALWDWLKTRAADNVVMV